MAFEDHNFVVVPDAAPVTLFQGYDTFRSAGRSTAVTGESKSTGAHAKTFYEVCTDFASLQRALDVSASVNASFSVATVDAKARFIGDLRVTTNSVTIVVYTNIVTGAESATNVAARRSAAGRHQRVLQGPRRLLSCAGGYRRRVWSSVRLLFGISH